MLREEAQKIAQKWLFVNGYTQWPDGVWQFKGYEVDAFELLCEYILSEENKK
jgi:hypothetical protein